MSVCGAQPGLQLFWGKRRISPVQHCMAVGTYRDQIGFWVQTVVLLYPGQRNEMVDMDKALGRYRHSGWPYPDRIPDTGSRAGEAPPA